MVYSWEDGAYFDGEGGEGGHDGGLLSQKDQGGEAL
jgi:hypothetical protein